MFFNYSLLSHWLLLHELFKNRLASNLITELNAVNMIASNCHSSNIRVRINIVLEGEVAEFLHDLKQRGEISTYADGVMRALSRLREIELETA